MPEPHDDPASILPRIRHVDFLAAVKQTEVPESQLPVTQLFVADLLITYAFNLPTQFQIVTAEDAGRLGLDAMELHQLAVTNLMEQLPDGVRFGGQAPVFTVSTGEDLEACTLLIKELWEQFSGHLAGEIVVGVPCRDVVIVSSTEFEDGIAHLRKVVPEGCRGEEIHGLSEQLFVWRDGFWQVFDK